MPTVEILTENRRRLLFYCRHLAVVDKHNDQFAMVSEQGIAVLVLIQRSMLFLSIRTLRNIVLQLTNIKAT